MKEPRWIERNALLLLHSASLAQFGGSPGIRDEALLDSALTRPRNRYLYDPASDLAALAAAYGYGLVRNHPFVDGNKRVAFVAVGVFLALNGMALEVEALEAIRVIFGAAAGEVTDSVLAEWIRANARPRD
jgi:death-on-curing protein